MLPYACAFLSSCAYAAISSAFGLSFSIDENFVSFPVLEKAGFIKFLTAYFPWNYALEN